MTPAKLLIGQVFVVSFIVIGALWSATQWTVTQFDQAEGATVGLAGEQGLGEPPNRRGQPDPRPLTRPQHRLPQEHPPTATDFARRPTLGTKRCACAVPEETTPA